MADASGASCHPVPRRRDPPAVCYVAARCRLPSAQVGLKRMGIAPRLRSHLAVRRSSSRKDSRHGSNRKRAPNQRRMGSPFFFRNSATDTEPSPHWCWISAVECTTRLATWLFQDSPSGAPVVTHRGVVLIDEVDVHLHVSWQRSIGFWLKKHFPNVQFIVTTHSPFVCQAADPGRSLLPPARLNPFCHTRHQISYTSKSCTGA